MSRLSNHAVDRRRNELHCLLLHNRRSSFLVQTPTSKSPMQSLSPWHNPNPTSNPEAKPRPQKAITAVVSQPLRRREASFSLVTGLCFASVLDPSSPPFPSHDIATAGSPAELQECPLIVAPSGLAFCDQVIGYGEGATKGLLIKAGAEWSPESWRLAVAAARLDDMAVVAGVVAIALVA
ncbi:hypothetical protein KSP40_PGU018216 [Platanthera guangdongensis]|uniref:Uncharacterized protein n=1 Tax=Platanthera guangdongensis TaxID=2320717 RepID=A0ABR2N146_9ASPA